jgi:hypothetical protein
MKNPQHGHCVFSCLNNCSGSVDKQQPGYSFIFNSFLIHWVSSTSSLVCPIFSLFSWCIFLKRNYHERISGWPSAGVYGTSCIINQLMACDFLSFLKSSSYSHAPAMFLCWSKTVCGHQVFRLQFWSNPMGIGYIACTMDRAESNALH